MPEQHSKTGDSVVLPRWTVHLQAALLAVVAATFFLLGTMFGSVSSTGRMTNPDHIADSHSFDCRIAGIVALPDSNRATPVVFILPMDQFPDQPLPARVVTPEHFLPLDNQTIAAVHDLGGAVTRVNEGGTFHSIVDGGRKYLVFAVGTGNRTSDAVWSDDHRKFLKRYFEPAELLIGRGGAGDSKVFAAIDESMELRIE